MPTYTDRQLLKLDQKGRAATLGLATPDASVEDANAEVFWYDKSGDDAMASTTTSETYTGIYFRRACKLKSIRYVATTGGITANATNYATITFSKRDSAAGNKTTVAAFATDTVTTDDVAQGVAKDIPVTAANAIISAGSTLTFEIAKAASGVVVRAGRFSVEVEWD